LIRTFFTEAKQVKSLL